MKKFVLLIFLLIIFSPFSSALIRINEFELNPAGSDSGNEWLELYSDELINFSLENWTLVNGDNDTFQLNGTINAKNYKIISFPIQWLDNTYENITLKNNTEIIFQTPTKDDDANDNKTWQFCNSTWIFESSTKEAENLCPVNNSENNQTNQTDSQNNATNQTENKISESSLSILAEYKSNFNSILDVDVDVYKGNTDKYALYIYIENNSKVITEKFIIHLNNKYTNYSLQIPLYIEDDCKYNPGEYQLIAEGLGLRKETDIELIRNNNSLCLKTIEQNKTTKTQTNSSKNSTESILNQKTQLNNASSNDKNASNNQKSITGNVIYESKKKINNQQITFLLLAILVCLLIYSLITAKKQRQQDI